MGHHLDLIYTYNQQTTSRVETLASKHVFEASCKKQGVTINHHHSVDGRLVGFFSRMIQPT